MDNVIPGVVHIKAIRFQLTGCDNAHNKRQDNCGELMKASIINEKNFDFFLNKIFAVRKMNIFMFSTVFHLVVASSAVSETKPFAWIDRVTAQDILNGTSGLTERYFKEKVFRWGFPLVENLGTYISKATKNHHCLLFIDNPRQTDISKGIKHPIIIRSIQPLMLRTVEDTVIQTGYGPENLPPRNFTLEPEDPIACPLSKFFESIRLHSHRTAYLCYHLNFRKFTVLTKSWNCHVQIYQFLPDHYYTGYFWGMWEIHLARFHHHNTWPSPLPFAIKIFVDVGHPNVTKFQELRYRTGTWGMMISSPEHRRSMTRFCSIVFLHFTVSNCTTNLNLSQSTLTPEKSIILEPELVKLCPNLDRFSDVTFPLSREVVELNAFVYLLKLSLPSPPDVNWIWSVNAVGNPGGNVIGRMVRSPYFCKNISPSRWRALFASPRDQLAHAYASIWFSLMGSNYTLLKDSVRFGYKDVACSTDGPWYFNVHYFHVWLEFVPFVRKLRTFPYFVQDELSTMRFISCGERGLTSLPFEELTNVFDKWIWLSIFISMISVTIALSSQFETKTERWSKFMVSVKVLLEQGNPFQDSVTNDARMRWIAGFFLMMGIVLSNSYKNTNVHNMIAPRKPIPYEYFKELIQDNFSVFTRVELVRISDQVEDEEIPKWIKFMSRFFTESGPIDVLERDEYALLIISEVATVVSSLKDAYNRLYSWDNDGKKFAFGNSSLIRSGIQNKSEFIISVSGELEDVVTAEHPQIDNYNISSREQALLKSFKDFKKIEETLLLNALRRCDKISLVLPEHLCYTYLRNVSTGKSRPASKVFVGKESFRDVEWLFELNGNLPADIFKRIKGIHEAGLWERWLRIVKRKEVVRRFFKVVAATMDGNIILIFALWMIGLMGSALCALLESSSCPLD